MLKFIPEYSALYTALNVTVKDYHLAGEAHICEYSPFPGVLYKVMILWGGDDGLATQDEFLVLQDGSLAYEHRFEKRLSDQPVPQALTNGYPAAAVIKAAITTYRRATTDVLDITDTRVWEPTWDDLSEGELRNYVDTHALTYAYQKASEDRFLATASVSYLSTKMASIGPMDNCLTHRQALTHLCKRIWEMKHQSIDAVKLEVDLMMGEMNPDA